MSKIYVIDLFCGAGGTSTGIDMAHNNVEVLVCVNHDANAIASHNENHPNVIHMVEDIKVLAMMKLKMRMLDIPELLKIQGFPAGYKLVGNKTEQKKFIGNSVECTQAKVLFDADYNSYAMTA